MKQINRIRQRLKLKKRSKLLSFLSGFLAILSIFLGVLIYMKKDENAIFLKENFNIETSFQNINQKIDSFVVSFFAFEFLGIKQQMVSNNVLYLKAEEDNYYYCESNLIPSLSNGIVYQVTREEDSSYTLLIEYDNELMVAYYFTYEPLVKTYDQIKKGDYISSYVNSFKALFKKNGKIVDYSEI